MKNKLYLLISFGFLAAFSAKSQTTTFCVLGDTLTLNLSNSRGNIQWQKSSDSLSWNDISGATSVVFNYVPLLGKQWVRAKLFETSCPEFLDAPIPIFAFDSMLRVWGSTTEIELSGQVINENNQPISGVNVSIGDRTATTDMNGVFYFSNAPVLENLGHLKASKQGFFPGSRTFLPTSGNNMVKITLLQKNLAGTVSAVSGGTVQQEGVQITFAPGGFTKNNVAYTGSVNVALNYMNPESVNFDSEMPGTLLGISDTTLSHLTSYGMVGVELTDSAGTKVELANGTTAEIRFPLSPTLQGGAPAAIDLWYFDEITGLWNKEGQATLASNEYIASVSHFSFWNCDIPNPLVLLRGQVINSATGESIVGAKITINSSTLGSSSVYTGSSGHFGGNVPKNEVLTLSVKINCGSSGAYQEVYTQQIGPFSVQTTLAPIQVVLSNFSLVTGTFRGCNNALIPNGYVLANGQAYFPDSLGRFSMLACGDSLTIWPFRNYPLLIGGQQTISLSGDSVNIGILEVCGAVGDSVIDVDGNVYATVVIGTQTWMAENLKTSKFADGSVIPNVNNGDWMFLSTPAWCNYDNSAENDITYGKLYNWYTVADPRNLCPAGWHVPSDAEWTTLTTFLGGTSAAGGKMKTTSGWDAPNTAATNESGFSGLPGGYRNRNTGSFLSVGGSGNWWSSSETTLTPFALYRKLIYTNGNAGWSTSEKPNGFSVRCLRD